MTNDPDTPLSGSCLCGGIRYEIDAPLSGILICHCSICRKAHSSAFRIRATVARKHFRFLAGEHLLSAVASSAHEQRTFCSVCASPIVTRFDKHPNYYGFALGSLDSPISARATKHVFVDSRAPWDEIADDLPQFPAGL